MAATMKTYQYPATISCREGISWSVDNRVAVCTDSGVIVLTVSYCQREFEDLTVTRQTMIPPSDTSFDLSQLTSSQVDALKQSLSREDYSELVVDPVMNPLNVSNLPRTGFSAISWSPPAGDEFGRCVLAVLSHDYRLSVYSQTCHQDKWQKVFELSEVMARHRELSPNRVAEYHKFRDWCHQQAAVAVNWYPELLRDPQTGSQYSVLAVAMESGHVFFMKIKMPVMSGNDCEVMSSVCPHPVRPSAMTWSKTQGVLALGYPDGEIHAVSVGVREPVQAASPQGAALYTEKDCMPVSCLHFVACDRVGGEVLLFNKEDCIMALHLEMDQGQVTVLSRTQLFGENDLPGTGFATLSDGSVLLSSLDGILQQISIDWDSSGAVSLSISPWPLELDGSKSWALFGMTCSPAHMFLAILVRISSFLDKLEFKTPTKVHIFPLVRKAETMKQKWKERIKASLLNEDVDLWHQGDVAEAYRQNLCQLEEIQDYVAMDTSVFTVSRKQLQIRRYSLMLLRSLRGKKSVEASEEEDKRLAMEKLETEIAATTAAIFIKYIQQCVENIQTQSLTLGDKDKSVLCRMLIFLQDHAQEASHLTSIAMVIDSLKQLLQDWLPCQPTCCFCSADMQMKNLSATCINGHKLGVCCKTLAVVSDFSYRTCSACGLPAVNLEAIVGLTWIAGDPHRCSVCEGLLFLT